MVAAEALATATSPEAMNGILQDIAASLGLSDERARLLVERFGTATA